MPTPTSAPTSEEASRAASRAAAPEAPAQSRGRAAALPVEERRAAIVAAALPLFLDQGAVTTREIAHAAGIAEGTIFRVFEDKNAVIDAIVEAALDPAPVENAIGRIDPTLPFEARLVAAVDILRARVAYVFRVLAMASNSLGGARVGASNRPTPELRELVLLFEREADRLRCSPNQAAHLLRGLTFSGTHSSFIVGEPLTSEEIVSVLLDGVRRDNRIRPC